MRRHITNKRSPYAVCNKRSTSDQDIGSCEQHRPAIRAGPCRRVARVVPPCQAQRVERVPTWGDAIHGRVLRHQPKRGVSHARFPRTQKLRPHGRRPKGHWPLPRCISSTGASTLSLSEVLSVLIQMESCMRSCMSGCIIRYFPTSPPMHIEHWCVDSSLAAKSAAPAATKQRCAGAT
jgi:hypothetical protein